MERISKRQKLEDSNSHYVSQVLGSFEDRRVMTVPSDNNVSPLAYLFTDANHRFFVEEIKKYLTEREIKHLRAVSKPMREIIFKSFPCLLSVHIRGENIFDLLATMKSPLPFPCELYLKLVISYDQQFSRLCTQIKDHKQFQLYAPNKSIKAIKLTGHFNPRWILNQVSLSLISFECGEIRPESTLDLSHCKHLLTVTVGDVRGNLLLPSGLTDFTCGNIDGQCNLNLHSYVRLTRMQTGHIWGMLKPPSNLIHFKWRHIDSYHSLNLSQCTQLESITVGVIYTKFLLSKKYHSKLVRFLPPATQKRIQWVKDG